MNEHDTPIRVPAPALVAIGHAELPATLPLTLEPVHEEISWTSSYVVEAGSPAVEAATADDYQFALVPVTTSGTAFGVVCAWVDPASGAIWAVAVYVITILAMRDKDLNKLVKRFAQFLQPPS